MLCDVVERDSFQQAADREDWLMLQEHDIVNRQVGDAVVDGGFAGVGEDIGLVDSVFFDLQEMIEGTMDSFVVQQTQQTNTTHIAQPLIDAVHEGDVSV